MDAGETGYFGRVVVVVVVMVVVTRRTTTKDLAGVARRGGETE